MSAQKNPTLFLVIISIAIYQVTSTSLLHLYLNAAKTSNATTAGDQVEFSSAEEKLKAGVGHVSTWLQSVDGLEEWEKNLEMGDAYFPTSAKSELARARFTIGLLALHNFGYDLAKEEFQWARDNELAETGRDFPMALWGSAVSTMQVLWQKSKCKLGQGFLEQLPDPLPAWLTPLEVDLVNTGFELYPSGFDNCEEDDTQIKREERFADALAKVVNKHPEQVDVVALFLTAKLATFGRPRCLQDVDRCNQKLAHVREMLMALHRKYPRHTGVMHYIIHAFDDPIVFMEGNKRFVEDMQIPAVNQSSHPVFTAIQVARKYMETAKLCHALHMPSHLFIRFGDWTESSISNFLSVQACDSLAQSRGLDVIIYDAYNLYHSIEYLSYDYSQLGQYTKAHEQVLRSSDVVSRLQQGNSSTSEIMLLGTWSKMRSVSRQSFETHQMETVTNSWPGPSSIKNESCPQFGYQFNYLAPKSFITDDYNQALVFATIGESGRLMMTGFSLAKECAESRCQSCTSSTLYNQIKENFEALSIRNTLSQRNSSKPKWNEVLLMYHIFLGMVDMAELIRPHGFKCYETHNCHLLAQPDSLQRIRDAVVDGNFKKAIQYEPKYLVYDAAAPTLSYMPSYEAYGHALLFLGLPKEALKMFEQSLIRNMGRVHSLVGLARSHGMLGNMEKAAFFYTYLRNQLKHSDRGNLFYIEANAWLNAPDGSKLYVTRQKWKWPYL